MSLTWLLPHPLSPLGLYDNEHRTVFIVRLVVHFAGLAMIFSGSAKHSFLVINRRLLLASFLMVASCMAMEEVYVEWKDQTLRYVKLFTFKTAEVCLSSLALLGCFLLRSITLRESYRLTNVFFVAIFLHYAVLLTDNSIKLGYLGNSIISCALLLTLRDFLSAFQFGGAGGSTEAQNVRALMHLQALLTLLNLLAFITSVYFNVFGLKLAAYVLQIFAITLVYLFVRPYVEVDVPKPNGGKVELLGDTDA